jgi:16S rRNA (cytosine967-C5)-methyltransferase
MNHFYSYINSAVQIVAAYNGEIPFASFIKNYFSQHKKFGSKDRKQISRLCYSYFRLGKSILEVPVQQKILTGLLLCNNELEEEWRSIIKEAGIISPKKIENIFPWKNQLSKTIDSTAFEASFLSQPDLFLRIRPYKHDSVLQKLNSSNLNYQIERDAVRLSNNTKVDAIFLINKEVVVQDLSSQKIAAFFKLYTSQSDSYRMSNLNSQLTIWDCCAASGGKSILAKDVLGNIRLTVSDIRSSIIANLKKRFSEAGIHNYTSFVADITDNAFATKEQYDLVIADVPCTGSGTWARTPEQLVYFNPEKIEEYAALQKRMTESISSAVKPEGYLLYITCSVFKKENEDQVENLVNRGFRLVEQKIITGYNEKADTMFGALLIKK